MDDKTFLAYINATNKELKDALYSKDTHEERWDGFAHKSRASFLEDGTTEYYDDWYNVMPSVVKKY